MLLLLVDYDQFVWKLFGLFVCLNVCVLKKLCCVCMRFVGSCLDWQLLKYVIVDVNVGIGMLVFIVVIMMLCSVVWQFVVMFLKYGLSSRFVSVGFFVYVLVIFCRKCVWMMQFVWKIFVIVLRLRFQLYFFDVVCSCVKFCVYEIILFRYSVWCIVLMNVV